MSIEVPRDLLANAYLSQSGEPAWARIDALRVIDWARDVGLSLLGIEIWIPTSPGPTIPMPFFYSYEPTPFPAESKALFDVRTYLEAADYVLSFEWDRQDTAHQGSVPFFNFTFDGD
jgi:hypothetical protein